MRIHARPRQVIDRAEAEWIAEQVLADRGSYWVPVVVTLAPDRRRVDLQYGNGKAAGCDFLYDHVGRYAAAWLRGHNEGDESRDYISGPDPESHDAESRPCRYGFDEVRVTAPTGALPAPPPAGHGPAPSWQRLSDSTWRLAVEGHYVTGNDRADMEAGPVLREIVWNAPAMEVRPGGLVTPTTPAYHDSSFASLFPPELGALTGDGSASGEPIAQRVEFRWRGRVVHRVQQEYMEILDEWDWEHRSADGWDNCVDPGYLADDQRRVGRA
ncbi:hypothetical protein DEF23_00745 [Marinitenerispora sediminis]|uniref:Uncharacterized protein n=2 Tax=Marinitenerispora sediminis TaxID=1931232 RepID=A0A368TAI6_9ACTN|nr:hypothetical protein DEF28_04995 [Marinitenerispora sediminis]RCV61973.1 hypothetical protein DEF24_02745 [Marinitenerispora sediminis]RCV62034.1 hypothetical protein DEF23_00745 [Marinitenerispora sediminis]